MDFLRFTLNDTSIVVLAITGQPRLVMACFGFQGRQVMDREMELTMFLHRARQGDPLTDFTAYDADDQPSHTMALRLPVQEVSLNFSNLGDGAAAVILLLAGYTVSQINWDKCIQGNMTDNPKSPSEIESFLRWHLL